VSENGQLVAWAVLVGVVLVIRFLDTRPGRRLLRAKLGPLEDWWVARQAAEWSADPEYDEMSIVLRRQRLSAHVARLRRILATDEYMSATRQIANRIAYRSLQRELDETPAILPGPDDFETFERWAPRAYSPQHRETEVLEIGWRH
jgi:hypothetical protein